MNRPVMLIGALIVAVFAAGLSFVLSIASSRWAYQIGALDQPTGGRKIHTRPIPLFGGVGIAIAILIGTGLLFAQGLLNDVAVQQIAGFGAAIVILLIGGMTDDIKSRAPGLQIIFPLLASIAVIATGTGILQVTQIGGGAFSLVWWKAGVWDISMPADLITIAWLLFATYATKLLDGLDGLVAGLAVIGSAMVGALTLSPAYFQPGAALLAGAIGGSFAGFLPRNLHPAKQFLGEVGSTLAGFSLGFLAIISSAKVAVALAVLAVPLVDAILVVIGRLRRGASPWRGDDTHLHFRLLRAGMSQRAAVALLWAVSFIAGLLALSLQTRGKLFLVLMLAVLTAIGSWILNRIASKRSTSV